MWDPSLKLGNSIPWIWVLDHTKAEEVQLISIHFAFLFNGEIIYIPKKQVLLVVVVCVCV